MRNTRKSWLAVLLVIGALTACAEMTAPTHKDTCSGTQEWNKCAVVQP